jgi:hypothetical protein
MVIVGLTPVSKEKDARIVADLRAIVTKPAKPAGEK